MIRFCWVGAMLPTPLRVRTIFIVIIVTYQLLFSYLWKGGEIRMSNSSRFSISKSRRKVLREILFSGKSIPEDLTDEEYLYLLDQQERDPEYFGPAWLEPIQGSLASERQVSENRFSEEKELEFQKYFSRINRKTRFSRTLNYYFFSSEEKQRSFEKGNPLNKNSLIPPEVKFDEEQFNIKLSQLRQWYPDLSIDIRFNLGQVLESKVKRIRAVLLYYYSDLYFRIPSWLRFYIEEFFDKILKSEKAVQTDSKTFKECYIIRECFYATPDLFNSIIEGCYSASNIKRWKEYGRRLLSRTEILVFDYKFVRQKVRRRGYHESHNCNNRNLKDFKQTIRPKERKEVNMSEEARTIEEIRESIIKKQALLFEKRLDDFLSLSSEELSSEDKKILFNKILETKIEERVDPLTHNIISNKEETKDEGIK